MSQRRCEICGKEDLIPFKCSYCGKVFCAEHRLPEKHNCGSQPRVAPPYVVEKIDRFLHKSERFLYESVSGEVEELRDAPVEKSVRKSFLDKVEESRAHQLVFFVLISTVLASIFIVPNILSHHHLRQSDLFRFHLGKLASSLAYAIGTGWVIIGYGIPLLIPISEHSLVLCLEFYGSLAMLFLGYKLKRKVGVVVVLAVLVSVAFVAMESERMATKDFDDVDELVAFLLEDDTDSLEYTADFTCIDFSLTLIERAKESGYRLYFASDGSHAFCEAYIVTVDAWVEVEPQTDDLLAS